eukprot:9480468-Alexandrium_andersonii.AAC.1
MEVRRIGKKGERGEKGETATAPRLHPRGGHNRGLDAAPKATRDWPVAARFGPRSSAPARG